MTFTVVCPHCGAVRSVSPSTDEGDAEAPVVCFRCQREFFASAAARPSAASAPLPSGPLEVVCPFCRTAQPLFDKDPSAPVPCRRCGRVFTLRDAETRRRQRRRRPRPDPARALRRPANVLYVLAALELALILASCAVAAFLFEKDVRNAFKAGNPQNAMPANPVGLLVICGGMLACVLRNVFVIVGARHMLRRRSYGLALLGVIAAFVPVVSILNVVSDAMVGRGPNPAAQCNGCCAFLWQIVSVWALIVLCRPGMAARFGFPPPPWPPRRDQLDDYVYPVRPERPAPPPPGASDTTTS